MSVAWPLVPLGEVLKQVSRSEKVDPTKEYRLLGVRLDGQGPFLRETKLGSQSSAAQLYQVQNGDFIYSRLFAWRGAFGVIGSTLDGCYVSNEFPTFLPHPDKANVEFLRLWFQLPTTLSTVEADCTGSTPLTRNRFKESFFLKLKILLPSLTEQRRIVSRIEELAAKIVEARGLRRQAIAEAEALSRSAVEAVYQGLAARFGQSTLSDTCTSITDGDHNTPQFSDSGIKFIFVGNVSSGKLHFNNSKKVAEAYFNSLKPHRVPERGDILYSAVGATLGIATVVDTDEPFCFQRHIAILKPNRKIVESRYVWHMLNSQTVFEKTWSSTTGTAQPTVPLRAIRELPLPLPTISEQRQIVSYLDDLLAKVYELKRLQTETAAELDAMLPSILDKAFKGEL
jgi:type I restriction enzyme S subunit